MTKKNLAYILNAAFLILIMVGDAFYIAFDKTWVKGLTSALFVVLGAINLFFVFNKTDKKKFAIILLIGLFFAMLGDILLEFVFIAGAGFFALGHVFFFASYCFLIELNWKDFIYGLIIFIPSVLLITLAPIFNFDGILMEIVCVVYALIISLMVGKAVSNFVQQKSVLNLIILIGSALFFFSDLMLLLNKFYSYSIVTSLLCLLTYYPAEFLLANSILHAQQKDKE